MNGDARQIETRGSRSSYRSYRLLYPSCGYCNLYCRYCDSKYGYSDRDPAANGSGFGILPGVFKLLLIKSEISLCNNQLLLLSGKTFLLGRQFLLMKDKPLLGSIGHFFENRYLFLDRLIFRFNFLKKSGNSCA